MASRGRLPDRSPLAGYRRTRAGGQACLRPGTNPFRILHGSSSQAYRRLKAVYLTRHRRASGPEVACRRRPNSQQADDQGDRGDTSREDRGACDLQSARLP